MSELREWCPKMLREQLCNQSTFAPDDFTRGEIQRLINVLDLHRPLASNGKHGNLHTPTCGCADIPAVREGRLVEAPGKRKLPPDHKVVFADDLTTPEDVLDFIRTNEPVAWPNLCEQSVLNRRELALLVQGLVNAGQVVATIHGLCPGPVLRFLDFLRVGEQPEGDKG